MLKFIIALLTASTVAVAAGRLQNADFATLAQITGAGGTSAQLLNTSKIYDSTNAQLLDTTIAAKLNSSAFTDAAVTSKLITGYVSGAGTVAATDTILQAIQKLNGNTEAKMTNPMTTLGDIIYGGASGAPTRLAIGTNGQCLIVSGGNVSWGACGTSSPLTTKGDLYTYDTGNARLPVGTDGQILSANSATATGLEWITATGGSGAADYQTITFTGSAGFGTNTVDDSSYCANGHLHVKAVINAGTPAASAATITIPAGYEIDFTNLPSGSSVVQLGDYTGLSTAAFTMNSLGITGKIYTNGSTNNVLYMSYQWSGSAFVSANGNDIVSGAGGKVSLTFDYPTTACN